MLLTRQRLKHIDDLLTAKIRSTSAVNDLERQVRFLANRAHTLLTVPPFAPVDDSFSAFARNASRAAVIGSIFPEFPTEAVRFAKNQSWIYDTIHRGNPDPSREMVLARSTQLMLEFWKQYETLAGAGVAVAEKNSVRAFVLGWATHIATDVVAVPYIKALEWRLDRDKNRFRDPLLIDSSLDGYAAIRLFGLEATGGKIWTDWWPPAKILPANVFEAYKAALEALYGPGARPAGSRFFERSLPQNLPSLSVDVLRDAYTAYRAQLHGRIALTYGDWLAAMIPIYVGSLIVYPLMTALPHTRALFKDGALVDGQPPDKDRGWFGLMMAPLAASGLTPLIFSIMMMASSYMGATVESIYGLIHGLITLAMSIAFLVLGTKSDDDTHWAIRWFVLFSVPMIAQIVHIIIVGVRGNDRKRNQLMWLSLLHLFMIVNFILWYLAVLRFGVEDWLDRKAEGKEWSSPAFWGLAALWFVLMTLGWLLLPLAFRDRMLPEPAPQFVRTFDHATMFADVRLSNQSPVDIPRRDLSKFFYPSDRRPVLKLWWEGADNLFIRSDRLALVFSTSDESTAADRTVMAPVAPMLVAQYATFLMSAIAGLKAEPFLPEDFDYELPPGEVFADHGDEEKTRPDHDDKAKKFEKLPKSSGSAYILYHASRARQAVFYGNAGPVLVEEDRFANFTCPGTVAVAGVEVTGTAATRFVSHFRVGDVIGAPGSNRALDRVVVSVNDDQHLTINATTALAGAYQRVASNRIDDQEGAGTVKVSSTIYRQLDGSGTSFRAFFIPGDTIRLKADGDSPEERIVVTVVDDTHLDVDQQFSTYISGNVNYERVGRAATEGFRFTPQAPANIFAGKSLMDRAADLGALLAMGAVSHLVADADRGPVAVLSPPGPTPENAHPQINKVYQVFRNWNLNHRRANEWRMLISGGAISEKAGQLRAPDPLQPEFLLPQAPSSRGADTANRLGWVPLLRTWLDMARRTDMNSYDPTPRREGELSNRDLSAALAYVLQQPGPEPGL
jgi:hypothetical protein